MQITTTGKRPEQLYPCSYPGCKIMRTKAEGGTTFSVCDEHWELLSKERAPIPQQPLCASSDAKLPTLLEVKQHVSKQVWNVSRPDSVSIIELTYNYIVGNFTKR